MSLKKSTAAFALLVLTLPLGILHADSAENAAGEPALDWPQWRGPNRDALSSETGLLKEVAGGRPQRCCGASRSEPATQAFPFRRASSTRCGTKRENSTCSVSTASTGKELWRQELGAAFTHHYGNGPRSTPLVDEGAVFAIGTQGLLLAANKDTGAPLWRHDLVKEYASDLPSYGYSSSPLVVGDKLVVEAGGKDAAFMAFNKKTGKVAWAAANDRPAYSSPINVIDRRCRSGRVLERPRPAFGFVRRRKGPLERTPGRRSARSAAIP